MEAIRAAVSALEDELVTLLQRMVRLPTINPPGEGYEAFVADLRGYLDELGLHHRRPPRAARARAAR